MQQLAVEIKDKQKKKNQKNFRVYTKAKDLKSKALSL